MTRTNVVRTASTSIAPASHHTFRASLASSARDRAGALADHCPQDAHELGKQRHRTLVSPLHRPELQTLQRKPYACRENVYTVESVE